MCRHLPKCFDNVHNLEFKKDEAGDPTKTAIGMYSGEPCNFRCCFAQYNKDAYVANLLCASIC